MPDVIDDAWLADLLQHRSGMLTDAGVAQELAAALAAAPGRRRRRAGC